MKIYKAKDSRYESREGYLLGILAEVALHKELSSIGFFRPRIQPQGKLRNHYHEGSIEFLIFSDDSQIKIGEAIHKISPGDIVLLYPGEPHEILAGSGGTSALVIKLPNNPKDIKFL